MPFEFATATRIIFGANTLQTVASHFKNFGERALIVTGKSIDRAAPLLDLLDGIQYEVFNVSGEPKLDDARRGVALGSEIGAQWVASIGGGSVIDTGKAIAALLTNRGDPLDYLEVIGKGQPLRHPSAPFVAIPTTAGTGAEVTSNAVLASPDHQVKVSLRSPLMLPRLAVVDAVLTYGAPPEITAASGLDALTQVIEPYVSSKANPITDALCVEGIKRIASAIRRAYHDDDPQAREEMALGSLLSGMALSNAKLGAVHGIAGPFGGVFDAPHGAICARLLPYAMDVNIQALRHRSSDFLKRYRLVAQYLTGKTDAEPQDAVTYLQNLIDEFNIPPLRTYGTTSSDIEVLVEKSSVSSSMQGNPVKLTLPEIAEILEKAL